MRVLVDATTLDGLPSGAATRLAALGQALAAHDDVELLHLVRPDTDPLPGLACLPFPDLHTPWGRMRAGPRLDKLLQETGADLFHAAALPLTKLAEVPQLLTLHDLRFLHEGAAASWARRMWGRHLLEPNLRRARTVVAVSLTTADELASRGLRSRDSVAVVPNAPTPGLARVDDMDAIAAFRKRADLNRRYLLTVGPLAGHKRVGEALQLLADVRTHPDGADLGLVLAGRVDPEAARTVTARAERLGVADGVRLVGVLDDGQLAVAYSGAEALLSLGRSEGFAIPVVDAQSMALPVVATAAGALPEVAGDGAWLVEPEDRGGLVAAALDAIHPGDLREARLGKAVRLASRWSWETSAEGLLACWRATLEAGPTSAE
jgi:glycosyltransferase involved in cell wall biosynthesis